MTDISRFPAKCRKNIHRLMNLLFTDTDTAYSMMLMTAALMDLHIDDPSVVDYILMDCRVEVEA